MSKYSIIKVCCIFNRLQHSIKIVTVCTGKPKNSFDFLCCNGLEVSMQDFQVCLYIQEMSTKSGSVILEKEAWEESKHLKQNRALEIPPLSISLRQVLQSFTVAFNHLCITFENYCKDISWRMSSGKTVPLVPLQHASD